MASGSHGLQKVLQAAFCGSLLLALKLLWLLHFSPVILDQRKFSLSLLALFLRCSAHDKPVKSLAKPIPLIGCQQELAAGGILHGGAMPVMVVPSPVSVICQEHKCCALLRFCQPNYSIGASLKLNRDCDVFVSNSALGILQQKYEVRVRQVLLRNKKFYSVTEMIYARCMRLQTHRWIKF